MRKHLINNIEEYNFCLSKGTDPLFFNRFIKMDIKLRVNVQNKLFGGASAHKNILQANDKYYHYCFERSYKTCENCGYPLYKLRNLDNVYSSVYVSHILTRGSNPQLAHDPRNHNILCKDCHDKWENGFKQEMMVYFGNMIVINEMKKEYML